jgi:hypothetical protein
MRRNLKKELIAVVRINNDFVTHIVNACGKRGYVPTHVFIFVSYLISKEDDNGADVEYDCDDSDDDHDINANPEIWRVTL